MFSVTPPIAGLKNFVARLSVKSRVNERCLITMTMATANANLGEEDKHHLTTLNTALSIEGYEKKT